MLRTLRKLTGQGRCGIDYLSAAFHRPNQACRMASTLPSTPIFCALASHDPKSTAILHYPSGRRFTYGDLLGDVAYEQQSLQAAAGSGAFGGERVAFLIENSYDYVVTLLSVIGSNAVALPLSPEFPASELGYILENSGAKLLLSSEKFRSKAEAASKESSSSKPIFRVLEKRLRGPASTYSPELASPSASRGGLMLYTSGTTSRPKGVLLSESVISAQAQSLRTAWNYEASDHLLHVLPLHHIHGTINALLTPLIAGASIEFMFPFNAQSVWQRFARPFLHQNDSAQAALPRITFFTVVPTIYNRLLSSFGALPEETQQATKKAISPPNLRVNISGSAALPTPTKQAWAELSNGNVLLERYGMTEVGMALSCGLDPRDRVDGSVGWPLPSVEARLVDTETGAVVPSGDLVDPSGRERQGEIQLRGPTVFSEYWQNPEATAAEFVDADGGGGRWFKTGDIAVRRLVDGTGQSDQLWARGPMYFILGRKSTDIIKTGGEKVSALEVERELLSLPEIAEAAVVGVLSEQWGQKVAAVVVLDPKLASASERGWGVMDMRRALKDKLARYKVPQELKILESGLPRNAMGKVNKKSLVQQVFGETRK